MPMHNPMNDPITPITTASTIIERNMLDLDAPIARRTPISRTLSFKFIVAANITRIIAITTAIDENE